MSDAIGQTLHKEGFNKEEVYTQLVQVVSEAHILCDEPMCEHTTFKVGGPADLFVMPSNQEQLAQVIELLYRLDAPYFILGNGSNVLVADEGFRGVIVCTMPELQTIEVHDTNIVAAAGVALSELCDIACKHQLTGLEFACGIPGSVGGAVCMNAGAYEGQIADVVSSVVACDSSGAIIHLTKDELQFGYRASRIKSEGMVCLEATFSLVQGIEQDIRATMDELTRRRQEKQPLELPSAGSTFKRPTGYFAGKLISDAGLKGYAIGGAQVSEKHAGFVVNANNATAQDIHQLIRYIQHEVKRQFGVELEPEVRMLP